MRVESLRLVPFIDLHVPGAPFYAAHRTQRGPYLRHRNRDYAEFTAIAGGRGRLVTYVEGREPRVDSLVPGQIHLFRPIDVHEYVGDATVGLTFYNIAFPVTPWMDFLRLAELDPGLMTSPWPPLVTSDPADPEWLVPHLRALERFWNGPTMSDLIDFWNAMGRRFAPAHSSPTAPGIPAWFRDALEQMRDEENLRVGMDRFVALSHVSGEHLSRTAMRFSGMTPTQLVGQLRMRRAAMLLATTSESVAAIAGRVGFASASYFSKAFRAAHLVSPRQYRARLAADSLDDVAS